MAKRGFVTISDQNYFPGVVALINSLRRYHAEPITVIDQGLRPDQVCTLREAGVDVRRVERTVTSHSERYGCCYAIFDMDAAAFDHILCIDPDAIVLGRLDDVFRLLHDDLVCATSGNAFRLLHEPTYRRKLRHSFPKPAWRFLSRHPRFMGPARHCYHSLNSGVVGACRELLPRLRQAAQKFADFYDAFLLPDQDLMALCLADLGVRFQPLSAEFNAVGLHWNSGNMLLPRRFRERAAKLDGSVTWENGRPSVHTGSRSMIPRIVHYAGPDKPWREEHVLRPGFHELWRHHYNNGVLATFFGTPVTA